MFLLLVLQIDQTYWTLHFFGLAGKPEPTVS
jgi:hypothetical protein